MFPQPEENIRTAGTTAKTDEADEYNDRPQNCAKGPVGDHLPQLDRTASKTLRRQLQMVYFYASSDRGVLGKTIVSGFCRWRLIADMSIKSIHKYKKCIPIKSFADIPYLVVVIATAVTL